MTKNFTLSYIFRPAEAIRMHTRPVNVDSFSLVGQLRGSQITQSPPFNFLGFTPLRRIMQLSIDVKSLRETADWKLIVSNRNTCASAGVMKFVTYLSKVGTLEYREMFWIYRKIFKKSYFFEMQRD